MTPEHKTLAQWTADGGYYLPLILPEGLVEHYHSKGQISKAEYDLLHQDYVVKIAGWWCILSRKLNVSTP